MSSVVQHLSHVFPDLTIAQCAARALVFTSANAGVCALTGHLFSLVTPAAGAVFGAATGLISLGLGANFALKDLHKCTDLPEIAGRVARTALSVFVGGGISYLMANAAGFTIGTPAALVLTGSLLATSLGFIALAIAYASATKYASQPMGAYVGELQKKWQFPSDHLPIGMTFDHFNFVSWNVLDAKFMSWVTKKNSQGLSRSMIADEHVYIGDSKLTIRDQHVAKLILQMISHPTHPRSILSLQECSQPFIEELRSQLPPHFEVISNDGRSFLLDRRLFKVVSAKGVSGIFTNEPNTTLQDITIRRLDNGQLLRLVNVHLPGNPTKPARFELAQYLAKTFDPALATICMGDMNFNELEMSDAMKQAFQNNSPFSLYSPYCTNISPVALKSKATDHFLVYSPKTSSIVLSRPNEVISGLARSVALL